MADFRKWLYAFAVVALLAGLTIPASAQTSVLMQCAGSANNPLIRAEDYTALSGDIFVTCTGGIPTAQGALIPKVNITIFVTNTTITSKLTETADDPNFNEVLLVVDEAGSVGSANKILNCGDTGAGAPYGNTPFTCDTFAVGGGIGAYDGNEGHPNVFQGRQVDNSSGHAIQFIGVPIDPPGPTNGIGPIPTRTLRITNLRVNAVAFNVTLTQGFSLTTINTTISFNGTNFGGNQIVNVQNGTVRVGLVVTAGTNDFDDTEEDSASFLQCNARAGGVDTSILLTEGFPTAFKVRNWREIQINGVRPAVSGGDWTWNGTSIWSATDVNQNVPNALYNTESGLMFPCGDSNPVPGNPPPGTGPSGASPGGNCFTNDQSIGDAGTASQGTRFAIQFSNIPIGSNPSTPLRVTLHTGAGDDDTGVMVLVCGTDSQGAGGLPNSCPNNGIANTSLVPSSGLVIYEVLFSNPSALEWANVDVSVNPLIDLGANPPVGGTPQVGVTATAQAGFAPFYATSVAGVGQAQFEFDLPIPRFRDDVTSATPISLYSYSKCACDLLFPWVVGDSTFTTSIVVANTSLDPCAGTPCSAGFLAKPQSGHVTFWFFGTSDITFDPTNGAANTPPGPTPAVVTPPQTSSAIVPAGSYMAFVISPSAAIAGGQTAGNGLKAIAGNFAGYVIAQSEFQYCHGIASISAPNLSPQTYLGLVLDKARLRLFGGGNFSLPTNAFIDTTQLRRTSQEFADELDQ